MSEPSSPGPEKTGPPKKGVSPARNVIGVVVLAGVLVFGYFEYSAKSGYNAAMDRLARIHAWGTRIRTWRQSRKPKACSVSLPTGPASMSRKTISPSRRRHTPGKDCSSHIPSRLTTRRDRNPACTTSRRKVRSTSRRRTASVASTRPTILLGAREAQDGRSKPPRGSQTAGAPPGEDEDGPGLGKDRHGDRPREGQHGHRPPKTNARRQLPSRGDALETPPASPAVENR